MTEQEQIEKLSAEIVIIQLESLCKNRRIPTCVEIAEALLKNESVVVLPCKVGDKFWWIYTSPIGEKKVQQEKVYAISIMKDGRFLLRTFDYCSWELSEVYFSEEEAEEALKRMVK